jgi:2-methylisocitrate lyase-like PEP mutase family enzyme
MPAGSDRVATFRGLHDHGCFVMPNPWDRGSAVYLETLGFEALATTSAGFAWSSGRPDRGPTLESALAHLKEIADAVSVPVHADFEGGFAIGPEGVAANVSRAVETGIAGLSLEDASGDTSNPLFDFTLSVERIEAARAAIDRSRSRVLLTGRSEGFVAGRPDVEETLRRLEAYAAAGADCLYAPGLRTTDDLRAIVKAVAPKPVNLLVAGPWITVEQASGLGVRRISVGAALARVAWAGFAMAAKEIAEQGSFAGLAPGGASPDLNAIFRARPPTGRDLSGSID